jgi:hypothetical protein
MAAARDGANEGFLNKKDGRMARLSALRICSRTQRATRARF